MGTPERVLCRQSALPAHPDERAGADRGPDMVEAIVGQLEASMPSVGTSTSNLIVIRGNAASGKSRTAQGIRDRYGRGIAIVGQDIIRRNILHEQDMPGGANIALIDLTARFALDHGYHVIVEGVLPAAHYGAMLRQLVHDHRGPSRCYYLDVTFEETLRRHATRPEALEFGEIDMRQWYLPQDYVPGLDEWRISEDVALTEIINVIWRNTTLDEAVRQNLDSQSAIGA